VTDDQLIRTVVIAAFLVLLPIGVYYRFRSQSTGEKLDRRQEGAFVLITLRPLALVCWLAVFAWMIDPAWMAWSAVSLPNWANWFGAVLFVTGCALVAWTFRSLGPNLTDTVVTRRVHTLVRYGPYRWIRHPLYDAVLLLTGGIGLAAGNWFIFAIGLLVFAVIALRTRTEERNLLARFGPEYRSYMQRTGRFIPRLIR
jgi:protein-S-isoprenylcysteine O-methyltransferase Ste14